MKHTLLDILPPDVALPILEMERVWGGNRDRLVQDLYSWPRILKSSGKELQGRGIP